VRLDPSRFDRRQLAALTWTRAFLTSRDGVPQDVTGELEAVFSPRERVQIAAAMKGMFCTNLAVNTQRHVLLKLLGRDPSGPTACPFR
jgi:hypothetical protein